MNSSAARARSFLFVPASRPERVVKALDSAADCIIIDLEDAVSPDQKSLARNQLGDLLPQLTSAQLARTLVRINATGTPWHAMDVRLLAGWASKGLAGAVVPKAENAGELYSVAVGIGPGARLMPLIESLAGMDAMQILARVPSVVRLSFGHIDFQLDLGMRCGPQEPELASVRFQLVAASRRENLPPPVDGVTVDTSDAERLDVDTRRSRAFGFGGKLCIHPAQVATVNAALSPSASEIEWAQRVVAAAASQQLAAFKLDGRMVDLPVIRLAEQTLERAQLAHPA